MRHISVILETLLSGDHLTDEEVALGAQHFSKLANDLIAAGPRFHIAMTAAVDVAGRLTDIKLARRYSSAA